jgi:hypothetical protein
MQIFMLAQPLPNFLIISLNLDSTSPLVLNFFSQSIASFSSLFLKILTLVAHTLSQTSTNFTQMEWILTSEFGTGFSCSE